MTSRTEAAHLAFVATLVGKAHEPGSKLVPPERNRDLVSRLVEVGAGLAVYLNVWDGDRPQPDEMLGTALGVPGGYDIRLQVRIELAVAGGTSIDREARFDDCRTEIIAALKPDLSSGGPVYLGGAVDHLELIDYAPPGTGLERAAACRASGDNGRVGAMTTTTDTQESELARIEAALDVLALAKHAAVSRGGYER